MSLFFHIGNFFEQFLGPSIVEDNEVGEEEKRNDIPNYLNQSGRKRTNSLGYTGLPTLPEGSPGCWKPIQYHGDAVPIDRSGHSSIVIDGKAYVFGGCGGSDRSAVNDLDFLSFEFKSQRWRRVRVAPSRGDGGTSQRPAARASFGMCRGPRQGTLVVSGGTGGDQVVHDDM
mmetsp:Transcript_41750/g.94196  ORF Transcript_41750/g.94196 Transcript_41750/m.94196 type:complete len:172 (+) Transcript_41750:100-615(+)